jgi:hypothetical protein
MAGKGAKTRKKSAHKQKSSVAKTKSGQKPDVAAAPERFVNDLQVRGEARKLTPEGKLPLGATHAIVKERDDGTVEVKRVRYNTF